MKKVYLLLAFLLLIEIGYSQSYTGSVIRVIDGDTFVFQAPEGSFKVRTLGTDAPERDQPYSRESAEFLSKYLNREAVIKISGTDRYGRRIGILFVKGKDINLLSIKNGCSWHYKKYSKDPSYAKAEIYARKHKIGLWRLPDPVPPAMWRKK
jgi:micrococcal nuclease